MSTAKALETEAAAAKEVTVNVNVTTDDDPDPTPDEMKKVIKYLLQCTICFDTASAPIHNCLSGHIVCGFCVKRLSKPKCPTCKRKVFVSVLGERMSKMVDLTTECPHCSEAVSSRKMEEHEDTCPKRQQGIDEALDRIRTRARAHTQLISEILQQLASRSLYVGEGNGFDEAYSEFDESLLNGDDHDHDHYHYPPQTNDDNIAEM